MSRLRKYLALAPAGRAIVLRSVLLLPVVAALLRVRGMARMMALLVRLERLAEGVPDALSPQEIARLVNLTASILGAPCLPRSLVLWHLLRCRGTSTEIRLGVSKLTDGNLAAHAWIDLDGQPLNDSVDVFDRYAAFSTSATRIQVDRP